MDTPTTPETTTTAEAPMFPQDFTAAAFRRKNDARIATLAHAIAQKCMVALEKSVDPKSTFVLLYGDGDSNLVQRDQSEAGRLVIANLKERGFTASLELCGDAGTEDMYIKISY